MTASCMSPRDFSAAFSYALSCVGKQDLLSKDKQVEMLRHLYNGSDVFLWVPTGYGKSLCYQVLPFLFDAKLGRTSAPKGLLCYETCPRNLSSGLAICKVWV